VLFIVLAKPGFPRIAPLYGSLVLVGRFRGCDSLLLNQAMIVHSCLPATPASITPSL
jgi:hypothetical protein